MGERGSMARKDCESETKKQSTNPRSNAERGHAMKNNKKTDSSNIMPLIILFLASSFHS